MSIEVYSYEPGNCFSEHYFIENGKMVEEDEVEYEEIYYEEEEYSSFDEFKEEYELDDSVTEDDLEDGYYYVCERPENWHI